MTPAMATKRQPGASGRLHRSMTGEWVWSSEEEGDRSSDEEPSEKPMNNIEAEHSSGSDRETENETAALSTTVPINLVLRMRNIRRELNDIRFEFAVGKDSAEGIATELMAAGLVDGSDIVAIASNLQKLIAGNGQLRNVTFPLNSGIAPNEIPDDKSLIGFAQISLAD